MEPGFDVYLWDDLSQRQVFMLLRGYDDAYYNDDETISDFTDYFETITDAQYDAFRVYAKNCYPTDPYFIGVGSDARGGKVDLPKELGE